MDRLIGLDEDWPDGDAAPPSVDAVAQALFTRHQQFLAQVDVLGTYYDIISLCKILPAFRSLRTVVISRFAQPAPQTREPADHDDDDDDDDDDDGGDDGDDSGDSFDSLDSDGSDFTGEDSASPTRAFWAVVKALQHCEYGLAALTIDAWHPASLYPPGCVDGVLVRCEPPERYRFSLPKSLQIRAAVQHLTSLTLSSVALPYRGASWHHSIRADILSQCARLERLCLEVANVGNQYAERFTNPFDQFPGFDGLAWARPGSIHRGNDDDEPQFPQLRSLELRGFGPRGAKLSPRLMMDFCTAHRRTLRSLSLRCLWLRQPGRPEPELLFEDVMAQLASVLELDSADLDDLRQDYSGPRHNKEHMRVWRGWLLAKVRPP